MSVRILDFYNPLPIFGVPLSRQWEKFRTNSDATAPIVRGAYVDENVNNRTEHDLTGLAFGELDFRNRYRIFYDKSANEFLVQYNTGTEAIPVWTTRATFRDTDGRLTINAPGGLLSVGGFYNLGGLDVAETGGVGADAFTNVGTLLFSDQSGFYLTKDSSGRPIVNIDAAAASGTVTEGANLGAGGQVFKNKTSSTLNFRSIVGGSNVTVTQNANDLTIAASDTGEVNTASNLGSGQGVWFDKQGVDLRFKSLVAGNNVSLSATSSEITVTATAPHFYGLIVKESDGSRTERDDTLVFDSNHFYLDQAGNDGKPLVSLSSASNVTNLGSGSGLFSSQNGLNLKFKSIVAGNNIGLSETTNELTITAFAPNFYGLIIKESDNSFSERDDTIVFNSLHFYLGEAGNDKKPLISLKDDPGIIFAESEYGGYKNRSDEVVFDSNQFYVSSNNRFKPFISLKDFSDIPGFINSISRDNSIINGNFDVWQRNTTFTGIDNFKYSADRWQTFYVGSTGIDGVTISRTTTVPTGTGGWGTSAFAFQYTVVDPDTSIGASEAYAICQPIEGNNIQRFGFGTGDTEGITLSFWVRSAVPGTYCVFFRNAVQNASRSYIAEYTINSANTYERKEITLKADSGGTWALNTNVGLVVGFALAVGTDFQGTAGTWVAGNLYATANQTNLLATANNTFFLSRVKLEAGVRATPFIPPQIGSELQLCQRYYAKTFPTATAPADGLGGGGSGYLIGKGSTGATFEPFTNWILPAVMRSNPTVTLYNRRTGGAPGQWQLGPSGDLANARVFSASTTIVIIDNTGTAAAAGGSQAFIGAAADAEL